MTDRAHSVTVVFEKNIRTDDLQVYIDAFSLIKGVIAVKPNISDGAAAEFVGQERAKYDLQRKLMDVVFNTK
jgi:hypothetical protein